MHLLFPLGEDARDQPSATVSLAAVDQPGERRPTRAAGTRGLFGIDGDFCAARIAGEATIRTADRPSDDVPFAFRSHNVTPIVPLGGKRCASGERARLPAKDGHLVFDALAGDVRDGCRIRCPDTTFTPLK